MTTTKPSRDNLKDEQHGLHQNSGVIPGAHER